MLTFNEVNFFKRFFNESGYILDFTDKEFDDFTLKSVGIPLKLRYKVSKGKSFEAFIDDASSENVLKLIFDLIEYIDFQDIDGLLSEEQKKLYPKLKNILSRFTYNDLFSEKLIINAKARFNDKYIDSQLSIMMSLVEKSPSDVIGKSKELLESCFKHILDDLGVDYPTTSTIAQLRKQVFLKLNLDPKENISAKNNNDVKKILSSFIQVVDGLNSLRNDKGDGHGKGKNYKELPIRYAKLAMNASLTIVQFTWDTYKLHINSK